MRKFHFCPKLVNNNNKLSPIQWVRKWVHNLFNEMWKEQENSRTEFFPFIVLDFFFLFSCKLEGSRVNAWIFLLLALKAIRSLNFSSSFYSLLSTVTLRYAVFGKKVAEHKFSYLAFFSRKISILSPTSPSILCHIITLTTVHWGSFSTPFMCLSLFSFFLCGALCAM